MGKSKTLKRTNQSKTSRKVIKRRGTRSRKYRGGECPCNKMTGGHSNFQSVDQLPKGSYIPVNEFNGPKDPISSRLVGGKKRVRFSNRNRIMRGGADVVSSFGNLSSITDLKNAMSLTQTVDPAVYSQTILKPFGTNEAPLV